MEVFATTRGGQLTAMRNARPGSSQRPRQNSLPRGLLLAIAAGFAAGAAGGLPGFLGGGSVSRWLGLVIVVAAVGGGTTFFVLVVSWRRRER